MFTPVLVSQIMWGRLGDILMSVVTVCVVLTSCSSEVLASSSIIIYDIYQSYIRPFNSDLTANQLALDPRRRRKLEAFKYRKYNRVCMIVNFFVVALCALRLWPGGYAILVISRFGITLPWLFKFIGIVGGACVLPIVLSITWYRTTGSGVVLGVVLGMLSGLACWLGYAASFPGGISSSAAFVANTGRREVFIVGNAVALGLGGLLCALFSICCGGCDHHRDEDEEWEKSRGIDNPMMPWSVRYDSYFVDASGRTGQPHFYQIRRTFRCAEISAYVGGVLLAVGAVFVWAPLMLFFGVFSYTSFFDWSIMVFIWGATVAAFVGLVPMTAETIQNCIQCHNNRKEKGTKTLDEDDSTIMEEEQRPQPPPLRTTPILADSDTFIKPGPAVANYTHAPHMHTNNLVVPQKAGNWKTFIHLDD